MTTFEASAAMTEPGAGRTSDLASAAERPGTDAHGTPVAFRATACTLAIVLLLATIIVLDVAWLAMSAGAVFGSCLTVALLVAGYGFRFTR